MNIGKIICIISNLYTVSVDGMKINCQARGKFRNEKITPLVGDYCEVDIENKYIMKILPRKNSLSRPNIANVDIGLIVTSLKKPDYSPYLLDKLLTLVSSHQIEPMICFTKMDLLLKEELQDFQELRDYYESLGYQVFTNKEIAALKTSLKNKVVVVTGQSGAGKSTLLNKMNPELLLKTSPISDALNRGVHTTRHTEIYPIDDYFIADTPGFSSLDIQNLTKEDIKNSFPEFANYECKFRDCNHLKEQDCGVKEAVLNQQILNTRYESYQSFMLEVEK